MGTSGNIEIIIDLQESSNAKSYGMGNRVHQREFDSATKLIEARLKRSDVIDRIRYNDTISILGSRGSGKTTFLLSLLANYKDNKAIEVLGIIDPTLIEEKGHVFLTIISLIEESVSKKLNLNDCSPNDTNYCQMKEWKDRLRKLADGLPSMDGVGLGLNDTNWQDAEFIMDRGLKSVKAATKLEENFNDLVRCALKTLEKKVFIITLDDIDVDFRKGWPVLETIRKYLTSPQIIVLLSGDLKLYSKAIRKQQWKNFGKALLINEGEKLRKNYEYNDLVTEMESQYMQKVIKPQNRIHLTTLFEKVTTYSSEININILRSFKNEDKRVEIKEIRTEYNDILADFGIRNPYQAEAYTSFLLCLPVRTQIQFLAGFNYPDSDVTDAFLSDLYEKEVDVDLAKHLPKMLDVVILKLLIKEKALLAGYQLQPTTTDSSLNSSLIALSLLFSQQAKKNPYLIFDYLIKIGYVQNMLTDIGYAEEKDKKGTALLKPSVEGLCYHSGIFQDKVLRDVVGNMTAYIESLPNVSENKNGIIHLFATAKKEKGSIEESRGRIDYEFGAGDNEITTLQQTLAFIPLSTSEFIQKNQSITTYSIYTLLGAIGELIRKVKFDDMENGLLELSQWRTYPMVSFERSIANLQDEKNYEEIEIKADIAKKSKLIDWINDWCSDFYNIRGMCSPHLIGKISTRIYYSFNSIKNNENLGVAMHRSLIALMNAILIEDVRENCTKIQGLNINNAVTSNKVFINNLRLANKKNKSDLSFSKWMLSCPLFLLYLDKEIFGEQPFMEFIFNGEKDRMIPFEDNSIFDKLVNVYIKETGEASSIISTEKLRFSTEYSKIAQIAKALRNNGLDYRTFEKINLRDFNKKYAELFSNKVNTNRLQTFKARIKEQGFGW